MPFDQYHPPLMNSNENYSLNRVHNMDTDQDPLDLLDIEWNGEDIHHHDQFHLTIDSNSLNYSHHQHQQQPQHQQQEQLQFGEVFTETNHRSPSDSHRQGSNSPNGTDDNSNMMNFGIKKPVIPTITTIYEPKFFEVFQAYQQYVQQYEPTIKNYGIQHTHLMTLCLNNLLPFSNWAREANNALFIRVTLFENPDMRPEVRNGLAMILVYVFSAAKANEMRIANPNSSHNIDMFTVLMKADTGLGIVNKTSLKIYSDPFGFFNFIKACLSGLIDAAAIPENERLNNQQAKRTRRGSKNKDEAESYDYLKTSLIALFEVPDSLQAAKNRVLQILNFWHVKGKSIRTERFSAIYSMMPNNNAHGSNTPVPPSDDNSMSMTVTSQESRPLRLSNRSSGGNVVEANAFMQNLRGGAAMVWDSESIYDDSQSSNSPHPSFYGENSARNSGMRPSGGASHLERSGSRDEVALADWRSTATSQGPQMLYLFQNRITSIPVPTIRFDRVGAMSWTGTNTFLYDFDELQKSTQHVVFYLIDEVKLKNFFTNVLGRRPNGNQQNSQGEDDFDFFGLFRFSIPDQAVSHGLTSLDKLFQKSGAIVTTWNQVDFSQMKVFINGWKAQSISSSSAATAVPPPPPFDDTNQPVLSPTNSMMTSLESFNVGSSPVESGKRLSKRRTSVDLKKDIARAQLEASLNKGGGGGISNSPAMNQGSTNTSRGLSLKSEHSPVGNEAKNQYDLSSAYSMTAPPALSIIEYWSLLRNQQLGAEMSGAGRSAGKGIIVFERSAEVGLIIRANPKFNIPEDIWCLFYVEDAIQYFLDQIRRSTETITSLHMSFGAFLVHLLPQTRILFQYLQHEQAYQQVNMRQQPHPFQFNVMSSGVTISYYSHRSEGLNSINPLQSVNENGPPAALQNSQYRTIGTLDQNFQQILSRFSNDCYFHDINLG